MVPKNADEAYKYLSATFEFADSEKDDELVKTFCKEIMGVKDFIIGLKPDTKLMIYGHAGFKSLPGSDTIDKYRIRGKKRGGDMLFDQYRYAVEEVRKIDVMYETPALEIIRRNGEVVGVVAQSNGKRINIRANRAVILTTGGYEYDKQSLRTYALGKDIQGLGSPGNTGDGLRMAQTMGARLWHMTSYSCPVGMKVPGLKSAVQLNILAPSHIWVDQDGRRFANELTDGHCQMYVASQIDAVNHRYPRIPCYLVFDHATLRMGPLGSSLGSGWAINREHHTWSKDCEKEIEMGLVKKANTIADLARAIKVPAEELEATIKRWNEDIRAGKDTLFGRPVKKAAKSYAFDAPLVSTPLEKGPYYALELWPTLVNTQGGPRRDEKARIVSALGKTIPRLYGAGELGSMWGPIYQGACNNAEALVFGRIAGRNAADEKPWC